MPIKDQHQYKKLEAELKQMKAVSRLWPVFWLFGGKWRKTGLKLRDSVKEMEEQLERLRTIPDRFNDILQPYGWIASEDMKFEAMENAVRTFEEDGIEAAEDYLEEHYNSDDTIEAWLKMFCFLEPIRPRRELLFLALEDHKAGRYHASVPVVLAQIDGIVLDLQNKPFYEIKEKKTRHLRATESIVGDQTGLPALAMLLGQVRKSTEEGPISLPYRNGILHGRDLGYANRRVSTKAFAALLNLRPWVLKVIKDEQFNKPPVDYFDPDTATWDDVKQQWKDLFEALQDYSKKSKKLKEQRTLITELNEEDQQLDEQTLQEHGEIDYDKERAELKDYLLSKGISELDPITPKQFLQGELQANLLVDRKGSEAFINFWVDEPSTDLSEVKRAIYTYAYEFLPLLRDSEAAINRFALSFHVRMDDNLPKNIFLRVNRVEIGRITGETNDPMEAVKQIHRKVLDAAFEEPD